MDYSGVVANGLRMWSAFSALDGGRSWWAHLAFTRINIEPTFRKREIEELMNVRGIGEASFLKLKALVTITLPRTERAAAQ